MLVPVTAVAASGRVHVLLLLVRLTSCLRFIRGKKRSGFDFHIELEWQHGSSSSSATGTRGTLKLPSASPDDLDDLHVEVSIDVPSGDAAADEAARQAAKQLKQPLQEVLDSFLTELRGR